MPWLTTLVRGAAFAALPLAVAVGGLATLLFVVADTWRGRALGLGFSCAALATLLLPFALAPSVTPVDRTPEEAAPLVRARREKTRARRRASSALALLALVGLAGAWLAAPAGVDRTASIAEPGLQSVWIGPGAPNHLGLSWVTPERDQIVLATHLVWVLDPLLDRDEASVFRASVRDVYDELDAAPGYRDAGSALGLAYSELLGGPDVSGHIYVDRAPGTGPQAALVFLHGWGGNGLSYLWVLRRVAHAHGYALVAPSYGLGLWSSDEGAATVERTLAWMESTGQFDMDRVALAALSNGGRGVPEAVERWPWRGVAWLSAVMYEEPMRQIGAALSVPLLVLHGGGDDRIPLRFVTAAVDALRGAGARVELDVVADADHFLLFTHRDRLDAALDRWLTAVDAVTP